MNPDKRTRDCLRKREFKTRKTARTAAERASANLGIKMKPYHCRLCGDYHLTKAVVYRSANIPEVTNG